MVGRTSRDGSSTHLDDTVSEVHLPEFFESRSHRGRAPAATASNPHRHPTCGVEFELSLTIEAGGWPRRCFERLGCEATRGQVIGNVGHESRDVSAVKPDDIVSEDRLLEFFELRSHRGRTPSIAASTHHRHPTCGDEIELSLTIEAGTLQSIRVKAPGCVVSQAAAILCEYLEGKPFPEVNAFSARPVDLARVISPGARSRGPRVSRRQPVSSIVSVAANLPHMPHCS
jgi:NifU-like protein involved in Fe-S cluster formation